MVTSIHVLRSNFTEIVRWEVGETICGFYGAILRPFGGRRQTFVEERAT